MLPVSLDCPLLIAPSVFSNVYLSCVSYVASFSGLSFVDCPFGILYHLFVLCLVYSMLSVSLDCPFVIAPLVFSNIYLSCVLCTLCCQFLWIVLYWLPLWYSLSFICPVYLMLPVSLDCPFLIAPLVFSNIYLSCVMCTLCCQFLWIVLFWLSLWYSLTFICPVSCVPYVASFSRLSFFDCPFGIL
jgi:hypothetical protein